MDLQIDENVARNLSEDIDDPELAELFEEIADEGGLNSEVSTDEVEIIKFLAEMQELKNMQDEFTEEMDLTNYDSGRIRGILETIQLVYSCADEINFRDGVNENEVEEKVYDLFPKKMMDELEDKL